MRGQVNTVPYATAGTETDVRPSVDPDRMANPELGANTGRDVPSRWDLFPEQRLMSPEVRAAVLDGLRKQPSAQREVVSMRDIQGWSSEETCEALGISVCESTCVVAQRPRRAAQLAWRNISMSTDDAFIANDLRIACADAVALVTGYLENAADRSAVCG